MRKSGGIIALIAGVFGLMAAVFTLFIGGVGAAFDADPGGTIIFLGWGGIFICFLIIVLGAVAIYAKTIIPGLLIIIASICGAVYGGTLVAVLMILAFVGGVLACMSDGNAEINQGSIVEPESKIHSLMTVAPLAVLILVGILYASKPSDQITQAPIEITIPADTELTAEPRPGESPVLADESTNAAAKTEQSKPLGFYVGKPVSDILNDETVYQISNNLLGINHDKFLANSAVSSGLEMDSNYFLGTGCKKSSCDTEQAAFAIDKQTGEMVAVLVSSEGDLLFGVDSVDELPANLNSWYTQLDN